MSLKNKIGYNDFVIWLRSKIHDLIISETDVFMFKNGVKLRITKYIETDEHYFDFEIMFRCEKIINNDTVISSFSFSKDEVLENDLLVYYLYQDMLDLQNEVKQCSKCQDWFLEEDLETTNLVEGSFCEQCLIDLREMK